MNFLKNDLIDKTNERTYISFSRMLNTDEFVEAKYNKKISKKIFENMKKEYKKIDIYYLLIMEDKGLKLNIFQKLKIFFSGIRPVYKVEKEEIKKEIFLKEQKKLARDKEKLIKKSD